MVKLSVIVLIYNMEELLPRCLQSLENQTMKGIQYILVDDGSKDRSGQICDNWKPENHTVKVLHKSNEGVVAGWMDGVNAADGEYVGFVDSDDYVDDDMFEELWKPVMKENVEISMCNHMYESETGRKVCNPVIDEGIYKGKQMHEIRHSIMPKLAEPYLSPSLCNKIFKKDLFKKNFRFCDKQVTIADDVSIVIPTMFAANSFSYIDKPCYHYVMRQNSTTYTYRENMYFQHERLLDNLERAIEYYAPVLPNGSYDMVVSAMGNQWLRMIAKSILTNEKRKELLHKFYVAERYIMAAKNIEKQALNKWARAYVDVVLKHNYIRYKMMMLLLELRNALRVASRKESLDNV